MCATVSLTISTIEVRGARSWLVLLLLFLFTQAAQADLIFFELDGNGDGRVSESESGWSSGVFKQWDRNQDGLLSYGDFRRRLMAHQKYDSRTHTDLVYGTESDRQRLDLYLPSGERPAPVLVWIHGGGWKAGDKYPCPVRSLVDHGIAVASFNYRYSTQAPFPAQLEDCRQALEWLRRRHADYGIDPERIFVGGSSAGGHLSLLLHDQNLAGICAICAPGDLTGYPDGHPTLEALVGGPLAEHRELLVEASPGRQKLENPPPVFLVHGTHDPLVAYSQSLKMADHLAAAHGRVDLFLVPRAGHGLVGGPQVLVKLRSFIGGKP